MKWQERGRCRGQDPSAWFPEKNKYQGVEAKAAIRICNVCPVQKECLDFAINEVDTIKRYGIWGGKTPTQRSRIKKVETVVNK